MSSRAAVLIILLVGVILGMLVDRVAVTVAEAQSPGTRVVLMGIHPTTGQASPISITAEGYINTKVIP